VVQAIELVHSIERSIDIVENINLEDVERSLVFPKTGHAVAVTDAPRGILMHNCELDDSGKVRFVNVVTPTSTNVASVESDLTNILPNLKQRSSSEVSSYTEMPVSAYDPCFSCSAYAVKVQVEKAQAPENPAAQATRSNLRRE